MQSCRQLKSGCVYYLLFLIQQEVETHTEASVLGLGFPSNLKICVNSLTEQQKKCVSFIVME